MKTKDPIADFVRRHQLASVMNKTKWYELADLMTANPDFEPQIQLKYLLDEEPMPGFTLLDWEAVKMEGTNTIEWLVIDPIRRDYVGRLVEARRVDFTDWVRKSLQSRSIPFEEVGGCFRIGGYSWPNARM